MWHAVGSSCHAMWFLHDHAYASVQAHFFRLAAERMSSVPVRDDLPMKMSQVVETVGQISINPRTKYIILETTVADESGEDIEIPYVRLLPSMCDV